MEQTKKPGEQKNTAQQKKKSPNTKDFGTLHSVPNYLEKCKTKFLKNEKNCTRTQR